MSPLTSVRDDVKTFPGPHIWVLGVLCLYKQLSSSILPKLTVQLVEREEVTTHVNVTPSPAHIPLDGPVNWLCVPGSQLVYTVVMSFSYNFT